MLIFLTQTYIFGASFLCEMKVLFAVVSVAAVTVVFLE